MTGQRQHQWQKIKRKCNKISSAERRDHISATPEGLKLTMRQAQSSSTLEIHVKRPRHPHTYMIAASLDSLNQSQAVQLCLKETSCVVSNNKQGCSRKCSPRKAFEQGLRKQCWLECQCLEAHFIPCRWVVRNTLKPPSHTAAARCHRQWGEDKCQAIQTTRLCMPSRNHPETHLKTS